MNTHGRKHVQIDGNTRDGALFAIEKGVYIGTRLGPRGKFDERKFEGKEWQVKEQWREWRDENKKATKIVVERENAKEVQMAVKTQGAAQSKDSKADHMFVLTFVGQRSRKNVALYEDMDAALNMASALEVALEATMTEGEYVVDELPVWR